MINGIDSAIDRIVNQLPVGQSAQQDIRAAFTEALNSPAIKEKLAVQLTEPIPNTPAQFRARVESDVARWKPVIEAANIKVN